MSINIEPGKFAELVVRANPSKSEDPDDIAKDSLELFINAFRLAERYASISTHSYDTAETLKAVRDTDLELE
ncbi:hypothetical protein [Staphylococcus auricularis]|uniref:hypothetical protein n=1 Tax=Staphylococcus auricularis TaxID=29379 RepID=UPI002431D1EF|nr:hypothetical protein [Staphylococcus auricularis]